MGNVELHARAEIFDGIGYAVHVAVISEIHRIFTGANPYRCSVTADRYGARVWGYGKQLDLEAIWQLDVGQHLLQVVGVDASLSKLLRRRRIGTFE